MGKLSLFTSMFGMMRAKMKQDAHIETPNAQPFGASENRVAKTGPALRAYRKARNVRNKIAARSRRVNQARREGVSI